MSDLRVRVGSGPILIHSDLREAVSIGRALGFNIKRDNLVEGLLQALEHVLGTSRESMIFPGFNYDFGTTRIFDVENDPVQVGALPELLRRTSYFRRTPVPFFSVLKKETPDFAASKEIDPFGEESVFAELAKNDGSIFFFGADIGKMTFIHHIESSQAGGPLYRYDKVFDGHVLNGGESKTCSIRMHVRPRGMTMEYDWQKIAARLSSSDALISHDSFDNFLLVSAERAKTILLRDIDRDPLFLIDASSREEFLDRSKMQHRLALQQFE